MRLTRRDFVKATAAGGVGIAALGWPRRAWAAFAQTQALRKFMQPLRHFGVDIPAFAPNTTRYPGVDYYTIDMREFTDQLHPNLPPTTLWGYGTPGFTSSKHLGGAIIAQKNRPVRITWQNNLPFTHPLPVDFTTITPYNVPGGLEVNRAAPHLHGGLVPWPSDGGPYHWFSSTLGGTPRVVGPSVVNWLPVNKANGAPDLDKQRNRILNDDYWYPNNQSARLVWYHDHAVGITRLNASIGLASGYIIQDAEEAILMAQLGIPAGQQIPIVFQDKIFNPDGSLWYPDAYDTQFFDLEPGADPLPSPSLVPEFWGDTILANGTVYPFLKVEPRRYRFRLLNACNTRFLSLRLVNALGSGFPANTEPSTTGGPSMRLIGTEGGFLDGTVTPQGVVFTNVAGDAQLVLAPAERAELIIDFSKIKPGRFLILQNDAPVPFPGGTPLADFYPENRNLLVPPSPGFGPNTRTLLQFEVVALGAVTGNSTPDPSVPRGWVLPPSPAPAVTVPGVRDLALYETIDQYGRLTQNLGDVTRAMAYNDPPTEVVTAGTVETWRIFNMSADTHPIHFHFFNVRVVSRQPFNLRGGVPTPSGQIMPPEPGELGWKETVRMNPGECITLLVDLPPTTGLAPAGVKIPPSPRLSTMGITGAEYVWHCHILEHEEHDMMRPLVVQD